MFLVVLLEEGLKYVEVGGHSFRGDTVVLEVFLYEEMKVGFREYGFFQFFFPCASERGDVSGDRFFNEVGPGLKMGRGDWGKGCSA